jgi:hypothetical protein
MRKILISFLIILSATLSFAEDIVLDKKDYLTLIVSNYVHGFKEFDTSVTSFEDGVSVGIYYDSSTQSKDRANQLAERFRFQIPLMLGTYNWAKDIKVIVNVYPEDRYNRGY